MSKDKKTGVSRDALKALRLLQQHLAEEHDEPEPDGYKSTREWAKAWGLSTRHTRELLLRALNQKLAKKTTVKRSGRQLTFYSLTPPAILASERARANR